MTAPHFVSTPAAPPVDLTLHARSRVLEVAFADGLTCRLPFELLRVYSPSAEVQGHGPGQEVLQTGKRGVGIIDLEPVGNYAIRPTFSDGHDSGLYTWAWLRYLGEHQEALWADYEERLARAGVDRDTPMPSRASGGCASHGH